MINTNLNNENFITLKIKENQDKLDCFLLMESTHPKLSTNWFNCVN